MSENNQSIRLVASNIAPLLKAAMPSLILNIVMDVAAIARRIGGVEGRDVHVWG
jgi:hypothetical protein